MMFLEVPGAIPFMFAWATAACAVVVWWAVYGGLLLSLTMALGRDTKSVQQRYHLYRSLEEKLPIPHFGFTMLSESLMIVILTQLWKTIFDPPFPGGAEASKHKLRHVQKDMTT